MERQVVYRISQRMTCYISTVCKLILYLDTYEADNVKSFKSICIRPGWLVSASQVWQINGASQIAYSVVLKAELPKEKLGKQPGSLKE